MHIGAGVLAHFWTPWLAIFAGRLVYIQHYTTRLDRMKVERGLNGIFTLFSFFFFLSSLYLVRYISAPNGVRALFGRKSDARCPLPPFAVTQGGNLKSCCSTAHTSLMYYTQPGDASNTHTHTQPFSSDLFRGRLLTPLFFRGFCFLIFFSFARYLPSCENLS